MDVLLLKNAAIFSQWPLIMKMQVALKCHLLLVQAFLKLLTDSYFLYTLYMYNDATPIGHAHKGDSDHDYGESNSDQIF